MEGGGEDTQLVFKDTPFDGGIPLSYSYRFGGGWFASQGGKFAVPDLEAARCVHRRIACAGVTGGEARKGTDIGIASEREAVRHRAVGEAPAEAALRAGRGWGRREGGVRVCETRRCEDSTPSSMCEAISYEAPLLTTDSVHSRKY